MREKERVLGEEEGRMNLEIVGDYISVYRKMLITHSLTYSLEHSLI